MGVISANSKRILALDGVRGLAVLSVVFFHYFYWCFPETSRNLHLSHFSFASVGWAGVNLFFVLSGFLITSLLLEARGEKHYYRDFYIRRALRILPALWLTFILMLLVDLKSAGCIGLSALFIPNFASAFGVHCEANASLWSLGVEEQFYVGWSLVVALLSFRSLKALTLGLCLGTPVLRYFFAAPDFIHVTPYRLDTLGWGALLAVVLQTRSYWTAKRVAMAASLCSLAGAAVTYRFGGLTRGTQVGIGFQFLIIDLACLSLVSAAVANIRWVEALLTPKVLLHAGRRSYCVYLVHLPIMSLVARAMSQKLPEGWAASPDGAPYVFTLIAVSLLATFAFAELSGRFVEEPLLRFKTLLAPPSQAPKKTRKRAA